jgi:hypothetical protein
MQAWADRSPLPSVIEIRTKPLAPITESRIDHFRVPRYGVLNMNPRRRLSNAVLGRDTGESSLADPATLRPMRQGRDRLSNTTKLRPYVAVVKLSSCLSTRTGRSIPKEAGAAVCAPDG